MLVGTTLGVLMFLNILSPMRNFGTFCLMLNVAEHVVTLCETPSLIPSINIKLLPNGPTLGLGEKGGLVL